MKITRKLFEQYLNEVGESYSIDEFIIGGKLRKYYFPYNFGTAIRNFDPTRFNQSYIEFKRKAIFSYA